MKSFGPIMKTFVHYGHILGLFGAILLPRTPLCEPSQAQLRPASMHDSPIM